MAIVNFCRSSFLLLYGGRQIWLKHVCDTGSLQIKWIGKINCREWTCMQSFHCNLPMWWLPVSGDINLRDLEVEVGHSTHRNTVTSCGKVEQLLLQLQRKCQHHVPKGSATPEWTVTFPPIDMQVRAWLWKIVNRTCTGWWFQSCCSPHTAPLAEESPCPD